MKTKEAISICNNNKHETLWRAKVPKIQNANMDGVIDLLKRGEKYEKIVGELERGYGKEHHFYAITNERFCKGNEVIVYLSETIRELKQKYFPKEE